MKSEKTERFIVSNITQLNDIKLGDELPPSDFSILNDKGEFIQFEYHKEKSERRKIECCSGIFSIRKDSTGELILVETSFNNDAVYEQHSFTKKISDRIDNLFNKIHVYKKRKIFPKRGFLFYGKPGVGKTQAINFVCQEYVKRNDTAVILWTTSDWDPSDVKDLIQNLEYKGVERLFLVAEDIGGGEYSGPKMAVKASMLSLLDNMESTFKIPTIVLATTNYPENLLEVLTDRPQRFDDVLEIAPPNGDQRQKLLNFFLSEDNPPPELTQFISAKKYDGLTIAHLKEVIIRAELNDLTLEQSADQVVNQSKRAKKDFEKTKGGIGISASVVDDSDDSW